MPQGTRITTSRIPTPIEKIRRLPVAVFVLMSLLASLAPSAASAAEKSNPQTSSAPASPKQPNLSSDPELKDKSDIPPAPEPGVSPMGLLRQRGREARS